VRIVLAKSALKALRRMQPAKAKDIRQAIDRVAANPSAPNNNLTRLQGIPDGFHIRVGDWRVSFVLDRATEVLDVFEIAPRGGAYR
jgi:mRNA interferase RelE/StbE